MVIRRGQPQDIKDYLKLQLEAFPTESHERHKKYFKQKIDQSEIFVLLIDSQYAGHITYTKCISAPFVDSIYVEELVVGESFRGNGYGSTLLDHLITVAKKLQFERIMLDTENSPRNKAVRFYLNKGFKKVGRLKTKYGNEAFYEKYV